MTIRHLIFCCFMITILTGCLPHANRDQHHYVREAYQQQKKEQASINNSTPLDEPSQKDYIINLDQEIMEVWQRYPWETVDQWIERIQSLMVMNNETIRRLRHEVSEIKGKEQVIVKGIQETIERNEELRSRLSELAPEEEVAAIEDIPYLHVPEPPFQVHLVKKGETLFSIARHYYQDPSMVHDIVIWNQGWVRNPEQIVAGIALVLFNENAEQKNEEIVEEFLGQYPAYQ